jgi:hypothetical protein
VRDLWATVNLRGIRVGCRKVRDLHCVESWRTKERLAPGRERRDIISNWSKISGRIWKQIQDNKLCFLGRWLWELVGGGALVGVGGGWWGLVGTCGGWWGLVGAGEGWWGLVMAGGGWWGLVEAGGGWWELVGIGDGWWGLVGAGGGWWGLVETYIFFSIFTHLRAFFLHTFLQLVSPLHTLKLVQNETHLNKKIHWCRLTVIFFCFVLFFVFISNRLKVILQKGTHIKFRLRHTQVRGWGWGGCESITGLHWRLNILSLTLFSHYIKADLLVRLAIGSHLNYKSNNCKWDCLKTVDMFTLLGYVINNVFLLLSCDQSISRHPSFLLHC